MPPTAPLPDGASASFSGAADGFPAYARRGFPPVAPFDLAAPTDPTSIGSATVYRWQAGAGDGLVLLRGAGPGATGHEVSFTCVALDDGEFSMPQAARDALAADGFTHGSLTSAVRAGFAAYGQGGALLVLATQRGRSF